MSLAAADLRQTPADPSGRFGTLYEIAQLLSSSLELEIVLQRVMDVVVAVTGAERGFVLLANGEAKLQVAVARNLNREQIASGSSGVSRSLCDRVFLMGEAELVADAQADRRTAAAESVVSLRLRSVLCAPLRVRGRPTGVVYLDHTAESGRFTERELRLLEAVGEQAAIAIENARLYEDLRRRSAEVADLKAYQDDVFRSVGTAIVGLDLRARVVSTHRAAEVLFGATEASVRGEPHSALVGDALAGRLLRRFAAAAMGKSSGVINASAVINGSERHLRCEIERLRSGDGQTRGIVCLADDETARVLADRAREREEAERRRIRDLFGRYVAEPVVEQLLADPSRARLGGVRREVSVLFADIRGYTGLSERSSPEALLAILGRYLALAVEAIREQRGTLDKFLGDGLMAVFNAPLDQPEHALAAVRAAWRLQKRAAEELEGVSFGVGVNTGEGLVGNIGTEEFRNYSCVGDVVNVASRMQGLAPGGSVYLAASTLARVSGRVQVEPLGPIELKGHSPLEVFRLLDVCS